MINEYVISAEAGDVQRNTGGKAVGGKTATEALNVLGKNYKVSIYDVSGNSKQFNTLPPRVQAAITNAIKQKGGEFGKYHDLTSDDIEITVNGEQVQVKINND